MKHERTRSNQYPLGSSSAKRRRSAVALLFVLVVIWATGCTENSSDADKSVSDKSGGSARVVGTQESSVTSSPVASSTSTIRIDIKSSGASIGTETSETDQRDENKLEVEARKSIGTTPTPIDGGEGTLSTVEARSRLIPLLPEGWHVMKDSHDTIPAVATGDLNKDGIPDVAAVVEGLSDTFSGPGPRSLLLAFGRQDNTLELSLISDKVVLSADSGGVYGDPFDGIMIERGTVLIRDYGGSNWRWYNRYRFRYQDMDWYLIGFTTGNYYTGTSTLEEADEDDYNLLTGDYILRRTSEEGKVEIKKGNRGRKELIKLHDFDLTNM
ncbi:hypothetical protein FE783_36380 [Paenibacillus mesophilus]|uniref:hypothetical protein n=1 Tax=Paenibacillus mesophilus TaxID=2582849 RepID=UPI00110F123B|nr:hypothetical protein [Paenibacillus mesophilus]TMV43068.1 hypothetical protein FE783_36380 [Paenibacillus mesophilus]